MEIRYVNPTKGTFFPIIKLDIVDPTLDLTLLPSFDITYEISSIYSKDKYLPNNLSYNPRFPVFSSQYFLNSSFLIGLRLCFSYHLSILAFDFG